mgnify:CR=1 FL=1
MLDPRSVVKTLDLFEVHLRRRDYGEAERYLARALELAAMVDAEPHGVHVPPNLIVPTDEDDTPSLVFSV